MGHDGNVRADRENAKNQNCADDGGDRTPSVKPNATNAIDAQCHAPLPTTYPLDAADDVCSAAPSCDEALRGQRLDLARIMPPHSTPVEV
jgi:hypothetical protein